MLSLKTCGLALSLLSRIPVAAWFSSPWQSHHYRYAPYYYGVVGGLFALVLTVVYGVLPDDFYGLTQAGILLLVWGLLSGGIHLVNLANTVDAYFASHGDFSKAKLVLQDPVSGPMATIVLVAVIGLKFVLLVQIYAQPVWALVFVLIGARVFFSAYILSTSYSPEPNEDGEVLVPPQPRLPSGLAVIIGVWVCAFAYVLGIGTAIIVLLIASAVTVLWRRLWLQLIGGYTGDVAGALVEILELFILLAIVWRVSE